MRTQVAIIGGGPAGMFLAHLLRAAGLDVLVLERRDREYVEGRVRAGVLEQGTVDVLAGLGLDTRLRGEALAHAGTNIAWNGLSCHIDFAKLTGSHVTVYGQQEVMRDLYDAAERAAIPVVFNAEHVRPHDIGADDRPGVTWEADGRSHRVECDFIAGCDGFHGVSRAAIPAEVRQVFERIYPFGWLGILADVPPAHDELIYASHERGFALASMRSPTRSRYYLQCGLEERLEDWPDERFWDEVTLRLGPSASVHRGESFEKSIAPLRSVVTEPMQHGRLFLLGDAAHIVPPTGAKGLNLAVSDAVMLSGLLAEYYDDGRLPGLSRYSTWALDRVWKAQRFSWWFTGLTHRFSGDGFERRIQVADLEYLQTSVAQQTAFAENYVGLPMKPLGTGKTSGRRRSTRALA